MGKTRQLAVAKPKSAVTISKAGFTATDIKNELYSLAQMARKKEVAPAKVNSVISAYRAILSTVSIEMKAAKMGLNFSGE